MKTFPRLSRAKSALRGIRFASSKPFYVSTPIFYVNASPHLGHLYSMLLADTRTRWEKLDPKKSAYFLTGTDEHGLKIQTAAEKSGLSPKQLVDSVSQNFKVLAEKFNVDYDRFIRTTDTDHTEVVQFFWNMMMEKGFIHEGSHSGWYSVSDETFYPETQIEEVVDENGTKKMVSSESRSEVVFQEEENYFFKLSDFQDQLISFLEKNPKFILPEHRYTQILNILKEAPLPDLSISRPSSRLKWSIEVPNDPEQKIYVWFDALLNYLTATGYPQTFPVENNRFVTSPENPWPATHIVGKDIIKFHTIYWPIFLLAAGIELPKQVIVHAHWLSDGFKMSKSLGNVVDPFDILEYYGEDAVRFFLMENSNIQDDCKYREELLHQTREAIIGKYANLMSRCGNSKFDIRQSVEDWRNGRFSDVDTLINEQALNKDQTQSIIEARDNLVASLNGLYTNMDSKLADFDHSRAIQNWWTAVYYGNQLFQLSEPWLYTKLLKDTAVSDADKESYRILQNYFVFLAAETVRITSILITPIVPRLSEKILDRLSVASGARNSEYCEVGADLQFGVGANSKSHRLPIEKVALRGD
ncbi:methionyl-tRNA synthetase, mitochondrial [Scheffersomyces stipitis CBS 6054]|uniref:Methionine--tRNA ligase, mitochondrial n=1 Tax=Scheffersomyces stipitis (strain ATCC 58785 / CBS 6054 / NBRC 10063 / NRRL Y-11545) TaxID=322104 RepID=A3LNS6_PICST|nr:methionyl-tRNA synthetase, mitochondrial [Scheffersomyces stipitis CBS 6054]ABN64378.2 methionyl-tRNA synthetase, mitochondrial [Scheffersomyces stipitis CBS 6054]KAG2736077.1 hypothetical protein G9P44_000167 [Scheffersomyces stipitis]